MKRLSLFLAALMLVMASPVTAAKPATNVAGAQHVDWNLSADVMPVPPYGSVDVLGSDTSSKLIVNQPNGKTQAVLTGIMKGLAADTTYTVYLSNGYTAFTPTDVTGDFVITFEYDSAFYPHDVSLVQTGSAVTGGGGHPAGGPFVYDWSITSGVVGINTINLDTVYGLGAPGTLMNIVGTVNPDGSMVGTWSDDFGGARAGTWTAPAGSVIPATGSTGYPGLYGALLPFTFTTNAVGNATWHLNLRAADLLPGTTPMSVWINSAGGTMLISDTFSIVN